MAGTSPAMSRHEVDALHRAFPRHNVAVNEGGQTPEPSLFSSSQGATRHAIQHPDPGRGLWVAAGLENAVRRPQDSSHLPARRGRPDQRRRLSRPPAGEGPQGSGGARFDEASRQGHRRSRHRRQPEGLRPDRPRHAGAAIPLAGCPRTARRRGEVARAHHVDHEHAAAALREAHPGPRLCGARARLHRRARLGQFRSALPHPLQPRSAGDPSAGREGQRADGHPADQLQGGEVRRREGQRHPAPAREARSTRCGSIRATAARSSCR